MDMNTFSGSNIPVWRRTIWGNRMDLPESSLHITAGVEGTPQSGEGQLADRFGMLLSLCRAPYGP